MEKVQGILLFIILIIIAIILFIIYNKIFNVVYVGFSEIFKTFFFCIVISYIILGAILEGVGCDIGRDTESNKNSVTKLDNNIDTINEYLDEVDNSDKNNTEVKYTDRFKIAVISLYYYNDEEVKAYLTKDLLNEVNNRYEKYMLIKGEILENININFDKTYSSKIKFDESEYVYPQLSICTKKDGEKIVIIDPMGFSTVIDRSTNSNVKYLYQGLFSENIESMKVIFAETDTPLNDIDKNTKVYIMNNEKVMNDDIYNQVDNSLSIGNEFQNSDYIFSNSDTTYLSDYELQNLDKNMLALARNEIFARHGYVFSEEPFVTYFNNKVWYTPNPNFKGDDSELNQYEIANYKKILEWENK